MTVDRLKRIHELTRNAILFMGSLVTAFQLLLQILAVKDYPRQQ
jgi:hypothetical protein